MSGETLQFWGLVAAVSIIGLGFLVVPLVRRRAVVSAVREEYDINVYKDQLSEIERDLDRRLLDEAQAEAARLEIKRRMLAAAEQAQGLQEKGSPEKASDDGPSSNLGLIAVIVLAIPAGAFAMYLNLGRLGEPDQPFASQPKQTRVAESNRQTDLRSITETLEKRLQGNPDDTRGWMLLGRSYMSLGDNADAARAYGRAYGLSGEDAEIGAEYAEALSLAARSVITPLAKDIFEDTLAADPVNAKARFYLAMYKAQDGDTRGALQGWVDLAAISLPDAPWYDILVRQIDRAGKELGVDPQTVKPSSEALALAAKMPRPQPQMSTRADADGVAPGPSKADVEAAAGMSGEDRMAMIRSMVKRLADRLKDNPDDKAGWLRLANAYRVLGETAKADEADARANGAVSAPAAAPGPTQADMKAAQEMSNEDRMAMIRTMVQRLADRLKDNPDDKAGWLRLANAYRVLGDIAKAEQATARAAKLP